MRDLKHKLAFIVTALLVSNGHKNWILPEPLPVKLSDMDFDVFHVYGLCASPNMDLFIMDEAGEWHKLEITDARAEKMLGAILTMILKHGKTVAA